MLFLRFPAVVPPFITCNNVLEEHIAFNIEMKEMLQANSHPVCFLFEIQCPGYLLVIDLTEAQFLPDDALHTTENYVEIF